MPQKKKQQSMTLGRRAIGLEDGSKDAESARERFANQCQIYLQKKNQGLQYTQKEYEDLMFDCGFIASALSLSHRRLISANAAIVRRESLIEKLQKDLIAAKKAAATAAPK